MGQSLEQAPECPGGPQFYDRGMMGCRAQDAEGVLHMHLATGDSVQKNGVAAEETLMPGLPVWIAFPQGLLRPRPHDSALQESPEGDTEGQSQPQDSVCLGEDQVLDLAIVANADPALGAGIQRCPHIGAEPV